MHENSPGVPSGNTQVESSMHACNRRNKQGLGNNLCSIPTSPRAHKPSRKSSFSEMTIDTPIAMTPLVFVAVAIACIACASHWHKISSS